MSGGEGANGGPPVRAVLADDERLMREQLRGRLAEVWPALQIVAEARNGIEAVELVRQHRPDLVFLDIRMPGMSGIDAAREIAQPPDAAWPVPEIVFITAYDQYAVEAFEQGVVDYVLKPAERERLQLTAHRIRQRLAQRATTPFADPAVDMAALQQLLRTLSAHIQPAGGARGERGASGPGYLQWIQAAVGQTIQMIPVEEVLFFVSDEKYTRVQTPKVEALIRTPIKELADTLDPSLFWRIHRSTLVNARAIDGITRDFRGRQLVGVKGHGEKLEVSRSYAHLFKGM